MTARTRKPDAGFTLIETLVALAVLAMSAVTLLATTTAHISRIAGLEARAAAAWTAENQLVALTLGLEDPPGPPTMLGYQFSVAVETVATSDADVDQRIILVTDSMDGRNLARLTGFTLHVAGQP
jgi:general secretion pathway protein I